MAALHRQIFKGGKPMKKFLSLVLALVMTMSLVTISAGATDFTDDGTIQYQEAIDVISAIKVVDGYTDGSFKPTNTLTRQAAAKIICNMVLGPTAAAELVADTAPYSDVPTTSEFAGYIAYCKSAGYISGYADGTFRPGNSLTGYAFMKMLLCALGYDQNIEKYVGNNWSVNVAKQAIGIGLNDGLVGDFNGVKTVNREEACLYAYNTLKADLVDYGTTINVTNSDGSTVSIGNSKAEARSWGTSDTKNNNIKDESKTTTGSSSYNGIIQFAELYFTDLKLNDSATDDFGRPADTWTLKKTLIGTYAHTADLTYYKSVTGKDICTDLDLDKSSYYTYDLVVDGYDYGNIVAVNKNSSNKTKIGDLTKVKTSDPTGIGTGSLVEVYKDEQVVTVVNSHVLKVDGAYDTNDEELDVAYITDGLGTPKTQNLVFNSMTLSSDDINGLDAFEDGDVVIVNAAYDGGKYTIKTIAKAESVTASVTEYVDKDTVTAGGETRSYNIVADAKDARQNYQYTIGDDATLYLDSQGNVVWAEGTSTDNYVFIDEFSVHTSSSKSPISGHAYFLDGTEDDITVSKVNGTSVKGASTADSLNDSYTTCTTHSKSTNLGWFTYTEKSDGKYELTPVTSQESKVTPDTTTVKGSSIVTNYKANKTDIGDGTYYGNKTTKFIVVNSNDKVNVYEGIKNVPDTVLAGAGYATVVYDKTVTSYAKYVFIDVDSGTVSGGSTSSDQVYIIKADGTYGKDSDGDDYYRYKAIVNGEEKTVKIDGTTNYAYGVYKDVTYNTKGYITDMSLVTNDDDDYGTSRNDGYALTSATTLTYKNNTLVVTTGSNKTNYYLADNCVIYTITGSNNDTVDRVSGSKLAKDYASGFKGATSVTIDGVRNADNEFTYLYVNVR
jgi:hypothetical protein